MIFVRTISYYFSSGDGIDAFFGIAPTDSNNDKIKKVISESEETFRELLKVIGSDGVGKAIVQLSVDISNNQSERPEVKSPPHGAARI
jgi:thioredoxin-like negative regulator of GroEL